MTLEAPGGHLRRVGKGAENLAAPPRGSDKRGRGRTGASLKAIRPQAFASRTQSVANDPESAVQRFGSAGDTD